MTDRLASLMSLYTTGGIAQKLSYGARIMQVGTQMFNSTIGQINPNAVEQTITRGAERLELTIDWDDEKYKKR